MAGADFFYSGAYDALKNGGALPYQQPWADPSWKAPAPDYLNPKSSLNNQLANALDGSASSGGQSDPIPSSLSTMMSAVTRAKNNGMSAAPMTWDGTAARGSDELPAPLAALMAGGSTDDQKAAVSAAKSLSGTAPQGSTAIPSSLAAMMAAAPVATKTPPSPSLQLAAVPPDLATMRPPMPDGIDASRVSPSPAPQLAAIPPAPRLAGLPPALATMGTMGTAMSSAKKHAAPSAGAKKPASPDPATLAGLLDPAGSKPYDPLSYMMSWA